MSDILPEIRPTAPVAPEILQLDAVYRQAFAQEKIKQSERFDDLAKVLFAIQLAALTAYFALLPFLLEKQQDNLNYTVMIIMAVGWFSSFTVTLIAIFPKKYQVMENSVFRSENSPLEANRLTIQEFYEVVTVRKRNLLLSAILLFLVALVLMPLSLLLPC
jgi:hypothetical protein